MGRIIYQAASLEPAKCTRDIHVQSTSSGHFPSSNGVMGQWGRRLALVPRALGQSALQRVGNTPLLRFERLTRDLAGVQVLAKAEWANPGGSVKDRPAATIVAEAIAEGKLSPGKTLLD